MKVQIRDKARTFQISLPTKLVFSRFVLRHALKHAGGKGLPPEAADKLAREFRRIREKHGAWELVEVQSADGEQVKVIL